jgi:hypothetical protein
MTDAKYEAMVDKYFQEAFDKRSELLQLQQTVRGLIQAYDIDDKDVADYMEALRESIGPDTQ